MKKIKRKILAGAVFAGCAIIALGGFSVIQKNGGDVIPVSVNYEEEKPIIVLDAGHGECF